MEEEVVQSCPVDAIDEVRGAGDGQRVAVASGQELVDLQLRDAPRRSARKLSTSSMTRKTTIRGRLAEGLRDLLLGFAKPFAEQIGCPQEADVEPQLLGDMPGIGGFAGAKK
jgi:hypothetical protein